MKFGGGDRHRRLAAGAVAEALVGTRVRQLRVLGQRQLGPLLEAQPVAGLDGEVPAQDPPSGGVLVDHTLATAVIGRDGRVVEIWRGNGWAASELVDKLR